MCVDVSCSAYLGGGRGDVHSLTVAARKMSAVANDFQGAGAYRSDWRLRPRLELIRDYPNYI